MKEFFSTIKTLIFFILIAVFTVLLYIKNNKIESLKAELAEMPKVEYIHTTDTIVDTITEYVKIIQPSKTDTEYVEVVEYIEKNLTKADSLKIGLKVLDWVMDYNTTKLYENVFKDDSSAYIKFSTSIYRNKLVEPTLVFENRYPVYKEVIARNPIEIYAGFGAYSKGLLLSGGLLTRNKMLYQVQVDPIHQYFGGTVSFRIFNFK